jgi:hypothetical protein
MAKPPETNSKQTEEAPQEGSTKYDRLERLANAATQAARRGSGRHARTGWRTRGSPQRCAT